MRSQPCPFIVMANIHIKPDVESEHPKPYLQYRRGRGMPSTYMWNVQVEDTEKFLKNYDKAFGHKKDEFIGGRNRPNVKRCKRVKCRYGYHSDRKRSGCVMYDDAGKCEESL